MCIGDKRHDGLCHRCVIAGRDEQTGHSVFHNFRNSSGRRRHDWARAGHCVEQRRPQALGYRAHHKQIEVLEAAEHVSPESREEHVLFEVVFLHEPFEAFP